MEFLAALEAEMEHATLILRDRDAQDDYSDWDPGLGWVKVGQTIAFVVIHGVDGPVRCEIWRHGALRRLPVKIFSEQIETASGWLLLEDPNGFYRIEVPTEFGPHNISLFADDAQFASHVQVIIDYLSDSEGSDLCNELPDNSFVWECRMREIDSGDSQET